MKYMAKKNHIQKPTASLVHTHFIDDLARLAEIQRKPIESLPSKALGLLDEPYEAAISVGQTPWTVSSFI